MPMLQLSKELWINPWRIAHITRVGPEARVKIEFSEGVQPVFIDGEALEILKDWLNSHKWTPLPKPKHQPLSLSRVEKEPVTDRFQEL